jgi:hypothetical protein
MNSRRTSWLRIPPASSFAILQRQLNNVCLADPLDFTYLYHHADSISGILGYKQEKSLGSDHEPIYDIKTQWLLSFLIHFWELLLKPGSNSFYDNGCRSLLTAIERRSGGHCIFPSSCPVHFGIHCPSFRHQSLWFLCVFI